MEKIDCAICGLEIDGYDFSWMTTGSVWEKAGLIKGQFAHLECVEIRLGRKLQIEDFPKHLPLNNAIHWGFKLGLRKVADEISRTKTEKRKSPP